MSDDSEALDLGQFDDSTGDLPQPVETKTKSRLRPSRQLKASAQDLGRADSLRHTVLTLVGEEEYGRAIERLKEFEESKHEYPQFAARGGRYIRHAIDLINAIKSKRSFPGVKYLAVAKQQELYDRAVEHFNELTSTLRKVEQIEREVRAEDVRSTVWIVKALIYSLFVVLVVAFMLELSRGVLPAAGVVLEDGFDGLTNWIFDNLGV